MATKVLTLKRADVCAACNAALEVGVRARWDAEARSVICMSCTAGATTVPPEVATVPEQLDATLSRPPDAVASVAGGSAQREYERRVQNREERIRERHPKIGGLLLALVDDPSTTKVWAQGAAGERAVGARLAELEGRHVVALHDRRMLRPDGRPSRANIDHLVVAAGGVWVVDAKTHQGRLEVRRSGGLLRPFVERLYIRGRDRTSLIEGLQRQVEVVRSVLAAAGSDVPVQGVLCFVGTELPWLDESVAGVPLRGRRGLEKLLRQAGPLDAGGRDAVAMVLEQHFAPALG